MNYLIEKLCSRPRGVVNASYKNINNFETSSEKECSKMDKENEKIYSKLLTQAEKAHNAIRHSGLSMNLEVPIPPRPSNRDRYLLWKRRNVSKKVIDQTEAVIFLESKGYKYNEHYEAYQAVDLANEIRKKKGLPIENEDETIYFKNVFTQRDKNIFRKRSMIRTGTRRPKDSISNTPSESSLDSLDRLEQSKYLRVFEKRKSPGVSSAPNLPVHMENDHTFVSGAVNASAPPPLTTTLVTGIQKPIASAPPQIVAQQGQQVQQVQIQQPQPLPLPDNVPKLKAVGFGGTLTF